MYRLALFSLALLLSGCGFALRGSAELPAQLQPLHLEAIDTDSDLLRELRRVLQSNRVALAPDAGDGDGDGDGYSLGVGLEERSERVVSVNVNARAGEYELTLALPWQLRHGATLVAGPERLALSRTYLADPENAVAKSQEAEQILREMRQDLSRQLLHRLQVLPLPQ
ncbi:MAG: LPS assembly lipoprotein LptE [Pseudomonadales bacterium]|jgi:LPS-assembly lipoprotein|nr:LPS assembly lipoprotein LptE [Pseudomonadales bacterium]